MLLRCVSSDPAALPQLRIRRRYRCRTLAASSTRPLPMRRERERRRVRMDAVKARNLKWAYADQDVDAPEREHHASDSAEGGEDQALCEKLTDEPAAAGAEGGTEGDFAPPHRSTCEQQVR